MLLPLSINLSPFLFLLPYVSVFDNAWFACERILRAINLSLKIFI